MNLGSSTTTLSSPMVGCRAASALFEVIFMRQFVFLCVVLVGSVSAQEAPYDKLPTAAPPYYRVRYEGSTQPGELVYPVSFTIWIPPHVKTLRGLIIHQ